MIFPGLWTIGTSVVTPHTADAVQEILQEIRASQSEHEFSQEELNNGRNYLLGTWPLSFENPNHLLNRSAMIWRYGLPKDWLLTYKSRMESVTLEESIVAWTSHVDTGHMAILVIGDAATIQENLQQMGLSVIELNVDGDPIQK